MAGITKSLGTKHVFDKFYTQPHIAKLCIEALSLKKYDLIIEPSAGSGAFLNQLPKEKTIGFDLDPEAENVTQKDWFTVTPKDLPIAYKILVIGNPPFGIQNNIALAFINHAATLADTVAFILPRSFRKESLQNRVSPKLHLVKEILLPSESFTLNGESYNVPCVFQVWENKNSLRVIDKVKQISPHFKFVRKNESPDLAIRRIGGHAGKVGKDLTVSDNSNYFIKVTNGDVASFMEKVNDLNFDSRFDTVGPRSLSKKEITELINKSL